MADEITASLRGNALADALARARNAEARLEHAEAALTGGNEGIRLWMLDCGELVAKHRARAEAAEAKLAEVRSVLLEGGQDHATARRRALAIIGSEEEGTPDADA